MTDEDFDPRPYIAAQQRVFAKRSPIIGTGMW